MCNYHEIRKTDLVHAAMFISHNKLIHFLSFIQVYGTRRFIQLRGIYHNKVIRILDRTCQDKAERSAIKQFNALKSGFRVLQEADSLHTCC